MQSASYGSVPPILILLHAHSPPNEDQETSADESCDEITDPPDKYDAKQT
jgi:hypothetical protein